MSLLADQLTAGILAGGAGSRLGGQDKGLMRRSGRPLVESLIRLLAPEVSALWLSVNRNHAVYQTVLDQLDPSLQRPGGLVTDETADFLGPMAGVRALWAVCTTPYLLLMPVDAPQVPSDFVARMTAALTHQRTRSVVAMVGRHRHYTACLLQRDALPAPPGRGSLRDWLGLAPIGLAPMPVSTQLSMNTVADAEAWSVEAAPEAANTAA
ncbi:MAG: NTP transferase domain-containing protein [Abyssibacter sp.]|uniref:NTP transferase domain-containing protein n=1 Tax=Abyssibacter sp. TaxID=2320200 RepID=UPI003219A326